MIPTFPAAKPLEVADRPAIERITRRFEPYSDYTFASLWCWDTDDTCRISRLNGNLVVRFKDYAADGHHLSFLGDREVVDTAAALLAHARSRGREPRLRLIPEAVVAADVRLGQRFVVEPDRDNDDYVYAVADWVSLAGAPFQPHRRKIARCRRRAALAFRLLDLRDVAARAAMVGLFHRWAAQKSESTVEDHHHESIALRRLFALAADDRLTACGAFDGASLVGFSVWERILGTDYAVAHFQKSDRSYVGLTATLVHEASRVAFVQGVRLMNVEQDLGIAGLRRHKLGLRPCRYLRKFTISERVDPRPA